jgi:hypothetical protein
MNRSLAFISIFAMSVVAAFAQTVDFRNNAMFGTPAERRVFDAEGRPLVGPNFIAQLLYGTSATSLIPHTQTATFRNVPTSDTFAGYWIGGTRTLTGFSVGQTVMLRVRAWDSTSGLNYDAASLRGQSATFTYLIPGSAGTPFTGTMEGFRSFSLTNSSPGVIRIREESDGRLQLVFAGRHNIDTSEDLLNWTSLGDQISPFTDAASANLPARFYRLHDGNTFSSNIVGYYRLALCDGFTMIANQLDTGNNTVTNLLKNPPLNTHVYKFSRVSGGYDSIAYFSSGWEGDDLSMTLNPGEGAFFHAPSGYSPLFLGDVRLSSSVPLQQGFSIISSAIPQRIPMPPPTGPSFGLPVLNGDWIYRWNCTGFDSVVFLGGLWEGDDVGDPPIAIGESFFFSRTAAAGNWTRTFSVGP